MRQFISFTNTGEKTAIFCLSCHEWRLELATDNYFQNPEKYYKEVKSAVDKKKITHLFDKYKGESSFFYTVLLSCCLTSGRNSVLSGIQQVTYTPQGFSQGVD